MLTHLAFRRTVLAALLGAAMTIAAVGVLFLELPTVQSAFVN